MMEIIHWRQFLKQFDRIYTHEIISQISCPVSQEETYSMTILVFESEFLSLEVCFKFIEKLTS